MLHRPLPCENLMVRGAAMARRAEPSSSVDVAAAARPNVMASPQKLRRVMGIPTWAYACGHAMVSATLRIVFPLHAMALAPEDGAHSTGTKSLCHCLAAR